MVKFGLKKFRKTEINIIISALNLLTYIIIYCCLNLIFYENILFQILSFIPFVILFLLYCYSYYLDYKKGEDKLNWSLETSWNRQNKSLLE